MITAGISILCLNLGFILVQATLVFLYTRHFRSRQIESGDSEAPQSNQEATNLPAVAIVLCVRGEDPSLESCINAIVAQSYGHKKLFIVGDHAEDPGIKLCRKFENQYPDLVSILINQEILTTCGVKCSHLISIIRQIENDFEYVVLVDADTVPHENWLLDMTRPFCDDQVLVTTGIRWFDVAGKQMGTWVRYIWNTAAIVQMVCYKIPWGGSLALRVSFLRDSAVLEEWSRGFCEDTMLQKLVSRAGGSVKVVPSAVIPSQEQTSLPDCVPWVSRQLLTARLHHPRWPLVLSHAVATIGLTFGTLILALISLIVQQFTAALWLGGAYLLLQAGNLWLLNWIEAPIRRLRNSRPTFWISPFRFLTAILLTQICYVSIVCRTVFTTKVEWRQVLYRIRKRRVEVIDFKPFHQESDSRQSL